MSHTSLSILQYFKLLNCTAHDILLTIYSSFSILFEIKQKQRMVYFLDPFSFPIRQGGTNRSGMSSIFSWYSFTE